MNFETTLVDFLAYDDNLDLVKAVYNRIVKMYGKLPSGFDLYTHVDAPA
jgi:hypothetical protein